jgi:two-component system, LuxR family, sensor kinase FixL
LASVSDISERKRLEIEARNQRDELTHLSRVSSLGLLSGSLAHEINQPLGIILANAQAAQRMLRSESPDLQELRDILDDIVGEDLRAGEAIKRLRALLKRGQTQLLPVNINEIVKDILRLTQSDLIRQGVSVSMDLDPTLPATSGDYVQLQQVVLNLILNACDAMAENPEKARPLHLSTQHLNGSVRLSVRDHGCGLPFDLEERVFQPFFTTKEQGLGIGLSISRSIIAAHHGQLWAERNPDHGTTFHLELRVDSPQNT